MKHASSCARIVQSIPFLLGLSLSPDRGDAADVKAFLGALSDGVYDATVPGSVPSGLTPGGPVP